MRYSTDQHNLQKIKRVAPLALIDALILITAYIGSYSLRIDTSPLDLLFNASPALLCIIIINFILLYRSGGYHRIWAQTSGHDVQVIVTAVSILMVLVGTVDFFLRPRPLPLSVVLSGNLIAATGFVAVRYRSRLVKGLFSRWRAIFTEFSPQDIRVLIVGAGDAGQATAWRLKYRAPDGQHYHVAGFVDDDPAKQSMFIENCQVLGTRTDIPRLVEQYNIELIVVAVHNITHPDFRNVLSYCERTPARIKIIPDVFEVIDGKNGVPLLRDVQAEDFLGRKAVDWHENVDVAPIEHKTILVTGAAGSIGSELCRQLVAYQPVKLLLLDHNESGLHDFITELRNEETTCILAPILADITDVRAMRRLFIEHDPQVVFHAAAYKHVTMLEHYPNESIRVNLGGTKQVAELAHDYGVERFVLISSDKAVCPNSVMGASKRICELFMHMMASKSESTTLFTSVRFGNVLDSRGSVVPIFNRQIDAGGPVTVTDKEMTRYFMTIPEAANLVIQAACLTKGDDLFMLEMGKVVRIVELAERMIRMRGLVPYKDIPIQFIGARPGEKLHEELRDESEVVVPTLHPHIIELINHKNGVQPDIFIERLTKLIHEGLNTTDQDALGQLCEIITCGEQHSPEHVQ